MKLVLHVDINSYFATLLQQENPHLRGKPIGVVKDIGRTCIIAASKEAKLGGIKTGTTTADARQRCPTIQFLAAEFDRYLSATRQLAALFRQLCPSVYIYSLDEAFLNISDCHHYLYPNPVDFAGSVQTKIKQTLGEWVTSNVGISHNFLLAKLASEIAPKGTVLTIDESNLDTTLAKVEFADVCGVGFRLENKLKSLGVSHPYQIRFLDPDELERWVGPFWQKELFKIAYGEDTHHFDLLQATETTPQMKTVSRSLTTWQLIHDEDTIRQILLNLAIEVTHKARQMRLAGRQIGIFLSGRTNSIFRHPEQTSFTRHPELVSGSSNSVNSSTSFGYQQLSLQSKNCKINKHNGSFSTHITLKHPINHTSEYFAYLYHHLYLPWQRPFPIIKFGVYLGLLQSVNLTPTPLLPAWHQQEKATHATDAINNRYGLFTLRPASLLHSTIIRPEVTGFLGDKTFWGV